MPESEEKETEATEAAAEQAEEAEVVPHGADEDEELPTCIGNWPN